jgi:hypothetical protein
MNKLLTVSIVLAILAVILFGVYKNPNIFFNEYSNYKNPTMLAFKIISIILAIIVMSLVITSFAK